MGVAATNRGSRQIARDIDRGRPSADLALLRDLTTYSLAHHGARIFEPTVIRIGPKPREASLMNRQRGGWGAYSYSYWSLWTLARQWRLVFTGIGHDDVSAFYTVEPAP